MKKESCAGILLTKELGKPVHIMNFNTNKVELNVFR